jgi:hypothetical protein
MSDIVPGGRPPYQGPVVVLDRPPSPPGPLPLLEVLSYVMDRCFVVPGSERRFGLASLLPFLPGVGDALAGMVSFLILSVGLSNYRLPRIVAARMVLNSLLEATFGLVPVLGNLFNFYYKADTRNVGLLRPYAGVDVGPPPSTWRHWAFVLGVLALAALALALLIVAVIALVVAIVRLIQGAAA